MVPSTGSSVGRVAAPDVISEITLGSGKEGIHYDFCEYPPASLSGFVYHDRNLDGVKGPGEEPILGVVLRLLDAAGKTLDTQVTDQQGHYSFQGLPAGDYTIVETQPEGWLDGRDTVGTVDGVAVGRAEDAGDRITDIALQWGADGIHYDFGELLGATIHGRVFLSTRESDWFDPDPQSQALAGVEIWLRDAAGQDVARTTTDALGQYHFEGLRPGSYTVAERTPAGLFDGPERVGSVDGVPTGQTAVNDTIGGISLGSGQAGVDYDFCEHPPSTIAGIVYHDRDNNGVQSVGEEPIGGAQVMLWDTTSGQLVATGTTDQQGGYAMSGLPAGWYALRQQQPTGWLDGLDTAGTVSGVPVGTRAEPRGRDRADPAGVGGCRHRL